MGTISRSGLPPERTPEARLATTFGQQIARWAQQLGAPGEAIGAAQQAAVALSLAMADGHVCLPLQTLPALAYQNLDALAAWRQALHDSGVVVQNPAGAREPGAAPLRLDPQDRLYLARYWDYEQRLAQRLQRAAQADIAQDPALVPSLQDRLQRYFPAPQASGVAPPPGLDANWQQLAVALALQRRLIVISGGPGTGKTTTVVKLLACLLEADPAHRIALTAPTGKAAGRMAEALRRGSRDLAPELQALLPATASTVHRLLQLQADGRSRYRAGHPLPIDTLVVDEASMLDLALATRLTEAVPDHARIVLLGDHRQLAAVESGAVFAEIASDPRLSAPCCTALASLCQIPLSHIATPEPLRHSPLADCVIWFRQNYRFQADSGIGRLARCIDAGDLASASALLTAAEDPRLRWIDSSRRADALERLLQDADAAYAAFFSRVRDAGAAPVDASDAAHQAGVAATYQAFEQFRILCAVRDGEWGVQALNAGYSARWRAALGAQNRATWGPWFTGRPVQIVRNDYSLGLFNGDTGITLPDVTGQLQVYFPQRDGRFLAIAPARLPPHETAFAMTVHKAQGAEFNSVLVVLPAQRSRVLSRELLYTAVTRARQSVSVCASRDSLAQCLERQLGRHSGLLERLGEATPRMT